MRSLTRFTTALCMVVGFQGTNTPKQPKQSDLVMVRGCLHGLTLTTTSAPDFDSDPREFQLRASREIAALLRTHTGHIEEVTGVLKAGKDTGATRMKEKAGAKGKIYAGFGTRTSRAENPASVSAIDVRSVTHVGDRCP
jgi:hypothetical protein